MNKITVRPIEKEDFTAFYNMIENNRQRLLMYFPKTSQSVFDLESAKKFTKLKVNQALAKEQFCFIITLKDNEKMIGTVMLKNIDWSVPKGELAYFIDKTYEGNGFTSQAVKWVTEFSFNDLEMEKLYIKFNPDNIGSKKVAIKNGFEKEGLLKGEFRTGQGKLSDVERFGLLRSEYS